MQKLNKLHGVVKSGEQLITLHHLTPLDLKRSGLVDDDLFMSYFKFTIIRDPFDRMASDYLWQQKYDGHNEFAKMSFSDYLNFAEKVLDQNLYFKKKHYDHFRPMTMYCTDGENLLVDDILLLENISKELARIQDKVGIVNLPTVNQSDKSYEYLRTTNNIDRVNEIYAADKVLYNKVLKLN